MAEEKRSFWKDFKKFISKGNVVDMAVGIVLGASFSKIVNGLVTNIINPFVSLFVKSGNLDSVKTVLVSEKLDEAGEVVTEEVALLWGVWFQTILDFLIIALCIFIVLRVLMRAKESLEENRIREAKQRAEEKKKKEEADKKAAEEAAAALAQRQADLEESTLRQEKLLIEIRDLLKKQ